MLLPFFTVIPGLAALIVIPRQLEGNFNLALPLMFLHYYPAGLLGVGVAALLASFMSGMAGNVTAFNTVWTYDIYQSYIAPARSDQHYLHVGRIVTVVGILLSVATAYTAQGFPNIFDYWALVSTIFVAAPFGTFFLGVFTRWVQGTAAFVGMLVGISATVGHYLLYHFGYIHYGSDLAMGFFGGFYGFSTNIVVTLFISQLIGAADKRDLRGLVYWDTPYPPRSQRSFLLSPEAMAIAALVLAVGLNIYFW